MAESLPLAAIWWALLSLMRPARPFVMRTARYRLVVHPGTETLTQMVVRRGRWEPYQTEVFERFLPEGGLVIDAGANFGHYALVASSRIGPRGAVIAFEPEPESFRLLQENISLLAHANVQAVPAGLGDTAGRFDLNLDAGNPGGHSFSAAAISAQGGVSQAITVFRLDDYLEEHWPSRAVSAIKIDVQGFEARVIRGAEQTILRDRPMVLCEITPDFAEQLGEDYRDIVRFFMDNGFDALALVAESLSEVPLTRENMDSVFAGYEYRDILFRMPDPA